MDPAHVASPEEVRRKWDALLSVINNVSSGDGAASAGPSADVGSPSASASAQDLLAQSSSLRASRTKPFRAPKKKEWNDRHHLMYSVVNNVMQKNVRAYFDRPRDIEKYGLDNRATLRTIWQLDTPVVQPKLTEDELERQLSTWQPGGRSFGGGAAAAARMQTESKHLTVGGVAKKREETMKELRDMRRSQDSRSSLVRVASDPLMETKHNLVKELDWNKRHDVVFAKDNHHYHPNFREYFERPRHLMW